VSKQNRTVCDNCGRFSENNNEVFREWFIFSHPVETGVVAGARFSADICSEKCLIEYIADKTNMVIVWKEKTECHPENQTQS